MSVVTSVDILSNAKNEHGPEGLLGGMIPPNADGSPCGARTRP
ncbi:hypothetical protein R6G69_07775 [Actinotignum urinale]|nr:hypothetical protein [Actinotignum urinale]MDY5129865.1 hypothetical protein [Actinotignum urinale]